MEFPTLEQVEAATIYQLCKWSRFLPSGENEEQYKIQERIYERRKQLGGFTSEISKSIGWKK